MRKGVTMTEQIEEGFLVAQPWVGRKVVRPRKPKKKVYKYPKRKIASLKTTIEYWCAALSGKPLKERRRNPGETGLLFLLRREYYSEWLYDVLTQFPRRRHSWLSLYKSYAEKPSIVAPYGESPSLKSPNPFLHSVYIAEHICELIRIHALIRVLVLRYIQRRHLATMNKRIVGEEDLNTTVSIPKRSLVAVYDFKTRSCYHFHTNTILRTILSSLIYSSYGIARPHAPKNPYTTVDWTYYQLMSIMEQITKNRASLHCILPQFMIDYQRADYNIPKFAIMSEHTLGIQAAIELFKLKDDNDTRDIYGETIYDMGLDLDITIGVYTKRMICERRLPEDLQSRWDVLVLSLWIHMNLHTLYEPFLTYTEMTDTFRTLYHETRIYVQTSYREDLARRQRRVYLTTTTMPVPVPVPVPVNVDLENETMEETSFINSFLSVLNL
jgi:hypothetical protein